MIRKSVLKTIRKHDLIEEHQHIVLGLSGGPDSVCLFHILDSLAEEFDLTIYPVHINHKFRPGAAEEDQNYAEELSGTMGWPCRSFVFDCNAIAEAEKMSSEEAGRKVRYESFARVAVELREKGIPQSKIRIAVAQNADDQAETILFRILRGAGTDGLSGISYKRSDQWGNLIIRPLLDVSKEDILEYCEMHSLHPQTDLTNLKPIYTRNKIRPELIPYLEKEYNRNIKDTMVRMGKNAAMDREYLWQQAYSAYEQAVCSRTENTVLFRGKELRNLHPAVRQRILSLGFQEIGLTDDVTFAHFEGCEELIFNEKPSAKFDLPKGYYLTKVYDDVKVAGPAKTSKQNICIRIMEKDAYETLKTTMGQYAAFDYDLMKAELGVGCEGKPAVRQREPGDFITIGENKTKKMQDYFIDQKIPKDERSQVLLLKSGHEVFWIQPKGRKCRFSFKFKLCDSTKNVICIEIIC